jgi:VanZ family protein
MEQLPSAQQPTLATRRKIYGLASFLVLAGILVACLSPFRSPRNGVAWLARGNGVRFGRHGTIISRRVIRPSGGGKQTAWTLEIWLRPETTWSSSTILAFYNPKRPRGFSLRQSYTGLLIKTGQSNEQQAPGSRAFFAEEIFRGGKWVFLTLVSGSSGIKVYVNGELSQAGQHFVLSASDLTGRLILANSPFESNSWSGDLRALALYNQGFTADQVNKDYESWIQTGQSTVTTGKHALLLYAFNKPSGNVIYNRAAADLDLYIPARYMEVHHSFLKRPWNEYHPGLPYLKDILINIAGFVPFGFLFYPYFTLTRRFSRPALITIVFGCLVSLTVEILQAYLPTRDSGMTDIITNTSGTAVGVGLFRWTTIVFKRFSQCRYAVVRFFARLVADNRQLSDSEAPRQTDHYDLIPR